MKQKDIIFIFVPIVIFVIAWIVFNIYHNSARSTISEAQEINLLPIPASFDTKIISEIKARKRIDPLYRIFQTESSVREEGESDIATPSDEIEEETESVSL